MFSLMAKSWPIHILSIPKEAPMTLWTDGTVLASFSGSVLCDVILCYSIMFPHWSGETSCHDAVKKVVAFGSTHFHQMCRNILCWSQCSSVSKQVTQLAHTSLYPNLSTISCTGWYPTLFCCHFLLTLILCNEFTDFLLCSLGSSSWWMTNMGLIGGLNSSL